MVWKGLVVVERWSEAFVGSFDRKWSFAFVVAHIVSSMSH
jgi:hypothetical protein